MEAAETRIIREYVAAGGDLYCHHTRTPAMGHSYHNASKAHRQYELLLLLEGEISYVIEGKAYQVRPGDMIFVAPGEIHALEIDGRYSYERMVLLFDTRALHRMAEELQVTLPGFAEGARQHLHIIKRELVTAFGLDRILREIVCCEEEPYRCVLAEARLIELAVQLDRLIHAHGEALALPDVRDPLIAGVVEYIDGHVGEPLPLSRLAERFYVSVSTLSHRFSAVMHISPAQYVTLKKMHCAAELLREGHSATRVAEMVGYDSYVSFFYNYSKLMKESPAVTAKGETARIR
ncbi:MAG: AraC family transcriptional regulator [Ruminococcaceae bacterium]|nr:AraC family transcriptional regulator [Oscillospiraceae bacterium]